jgi:hypothetical protein
MKEYGAQVSKRVQRSWATNSAAPARFLATRRDVPPPLRGCGIGLGSRNREKHDDNRIIVEFE